MITVVQYDNRPRDKLGSMSKLTSLNEQYCQNHNIRYVYLDSYHLDLPCYWVKVFLVTELLEQCKDDDDYVMWLDTDAVIHKDFTHLLPQVTNNQVMTIAPDPPESDSSFNARVFYC